jgi:hypothetical protein
MTEGNVNDARLVSLACYNLLKITADKSFVTPDPDEMRHWAVDGSEKSWYRQKLHSSWSLLG